MLSEICLKCINEANLRHSRRKKLVKLVCCELASHSIRGEKELIICHSGELADYSCDEIEEVLKSEMYIFSIEKPDGGTSKYIIKFERKYFKW